MITMIFCKFLSDLGIYYAVAGCIAVMTKTSAPALLAAFVIQAAAGTLTYPLRERKVLKFLPMLLLLPAFFLPGLTLSGYIVLAFPAAYVVWVCVRQRYVPDWDFQIQIFPWLLGIILAFCLTMLVAGRYASLSEITIPAGLVSVLCCVLLMQMLRHDESVWRQPGYQIINLLIAFAVIVLAGLLSSDVFLHGAGTVLTWIYNHGILPILTVILYVVMAIMRVISWLFSWVKLIFSGETKEDASQTLNLEDTGMSDMLEAGDGSPMAKVVLEALGIVAGAVIVILLFRWLSSHSKKAGENKNTKTERASAAEKSTEGLPRFSGSPVIQVRLQYKKFLILCRSRGVEIKKCTTSSEVSNCCGRYFDREAVKELREIYINARYNDKATKEDAELAKKLMAQVKKNQEP